MKLSLWFYLRTSLCPSRLHFCADDAVTLGSNEEEEVIRDGYLLSDRCIIACLERTACSGKQLSEASMACGLSCPAVVDFNVDVASFDDSSLL